MNEQERQEWEARKAAHEQKRADQAQECREILDLMRAAHSRLNALAVTEEQHGYATVGSAFDKMTRKAHALAQDCYTMARLGVDRGSQHIAG